MSEKKESKLPVNVDSDVKKEEDEKKVDKHEEPRVPEDQQLADYAYTLHVAGEEKMGKFAFKEACDYMIAAAEKYIKVTKMSKNKELIDTVKSKLVPLLDRVSYIHNNF